MADQSQLQGVTVVSPQYPGQQPPKYNVAANPDPQPMNIERQGKDGHVQDNLVISIISIFFCCILGIVATIKASNSKDALQRGDIDSAQRDSVQARKLAIAAFITGAVIIFIVILITVILPIIGVGIAMGTTNIN